MNGGDSLERVSRNRRVLGDVTNSYGKRGFPLLPGKFVIGNEAMRKGEILGAGVEGAGSRKRICNGLENLSRGKHKISGVSKISETAEDNGKYLSFFRNLEDKNRRNLSLSKIIKICESVVSSDGRQPVQPNLDLNASPCLHRTKEHSSLLTCRPQPIMSSFPFNGTTEAKKLPASVSVPLQSDKPTGSSLVVEGYHGHYETGSGESGDTARDAIEIDAGGWDRCELKLKCFFPPTNNNVEAMNLKENQMNDGECLTNEPSETSHIEASLKPTEPIVSKVLNLEEFENVNSTLCGNSDLNVEEVSESTKACSCSFCLKAAYMWTDLLYQDAKGRLAEMMKSGRVARYLAGRSYSNDWTTTSAENPKKTTRLEFDLVQRWRSLFLHTENVLMHENAQLQSNILRLKEIRENCKSELEKISRVPSSRS